MFILHLLPHSLRNVLSSVLKYKNLKVNAKKKGILINIIIELKQELKKIF
jgi:hypothetical protein